MDKSVVAIRTMKISDINGGLALSIAEGWNQTEKDWKFLIENPGNICLVAECDQKVIGTVTAMNYSNEMAWIGMVLVHKDFRGLGTSKSLLATIFKKLNFFKSIKLDATPAGQLVYEKFGFKEEYLIARMVNESVKKLPINGYEMKTESIDEKDITEIAGLDKKMFGADRSSLIEFMVTQFPDSGWLLKRNDQVAGFILGRAGTKHYHIGPLVATEPADAEILITQALKNSINRSVAVDVLYDKENLIQRLTSIGFCKQRHFVRMYRDENYFPGDTEKQYLICGPEFG